MKPYVSTICIMLLNLLGACLMMSKGEFLLAVLNLSVVVILAPLLRRELRRG